MVKVSWGQKIDSEDRDFIDAFIENYRIERGLKSKSDALVHFFRNVVPPDIHDAGTITPEIHYAGDLEFEETCPFGFLKRISDKQGSEELWHCLKQQGPDNKGKPMLLADGRNKQSIRAICDACLTKWQRGPRKLDQVRLVFEQLSQSEITSKLYFCTRDVLNEGIKLSTSEYGIWYCPERDEKITVKNTCIAKNCPFMIQKIISLNLIETLPFKEAQKALEVLK